MVVDAKVEILSVATLDRTLHDDRAEMERLRNERAEAEMVVATLYRLIDLTVRIEEGIPAWIIGGDLLTIDGWRIEREKGIFGDGGHRAFVASKEMRLATNFYPSPTACATVVSTSSRRNAQLDLPEDLRA